jgi:hypothetical protein
MKIHQRDTILPGFAALDLRGGGRDKRQTADGRAAELRRLAAWLQQQGVRIVAFEATGVHPKNGGG